VLSDAYIKGLRHDINWTDAFAAMRTNAEVIPDLRTPDKEGRAALSDWKDLGYVSQDRNERCVSRTVEYSLNDFALSQVAAGLGYRDDAATYLERSRGWQLSWDHDVKSVNTTPTFTGFLAPRLSNGTFNSSNYNPAKCGDCSWKSITYEATPFEYSFNVPHDMRSLIEYMGGEGGFEERLDYMFEANSSQQDLGVNGAGIDTLMNIGYVFLPPYPHLRAKDGRNGYLYDDCSNEPDFQTPYLYNYINKQHKSVFWSRQLAGR
jgi:putative alpha-1,2-mannosidase